jgi:hypothetical protein
VNSITQKRKEQVQLIGKFKLIKLAIVLEEILIPFQKEEILTVEILSNLEDLVFICQVRN